MIDILGWVAMLVPVGVLAYSFWNGRRVERQYQNDPNVRGHYPS